MSSSIPEGHESVASASRRTGVNAQTIRDWIQAEKVVGHLPGRGKSAWVEIQGLDNAVAARGAEAPWTSDVRALQAEIAALTEEVSKIAGALAGVAEGAGQSGVTPSGEVDDHYRTERDHYRAQLAATQGAALGLLQANRRWRETTRQLARAAIDAVDAADHEADSLAQLLTPNHAGDLGGDT